MGAGVLPASSCSTCGSAMVYVGSMPLRAPPGPAQWAISSVDTLGFPHLQHFFTILQPTLRGPCVVFDFQPSNPEDVYTAVIALSGGIIPGIVLEREISRLPARKCWLISKTMAGRGIQDAVKFNDQWDTQLQLWKHDCRHHTEALVEFLTGEKEVLQKLKNRPSRA